MSEHDQISVDSSLYHQLHGNGDELSSTYSDTGQIPLSHVYKMEMLGKIQDYATSRVDAFYASNQSSAGYSVVESSNGKSGVDEVFSQSKDQSLSLSHHGIQLTHDLSNLGGLEEKNQFRDNDLDMNAVANVDDDNDNDGAVNVNDADYGGGGADQSEGTGDDDVEGDDFDDDSTHLSLADLQPVRQIKQQLNSIKSALISHQVDLNVSKSDRRRGKREDDQDSESCWDVVEVLRLNPRKCAIAIKLLCLIPALVLLTPQPNLEDSNVYLNKSFETVNSDHYLMVLAFVTGVMSPVQFEIFLRSVKYYLCFGPNEDTETFFSTFTSENALQIYKIIIFRATFLPFAITLFYGMDQKRATDGYSSGGKRTFSKFFFSYLLFCYCPCHFSFDFHDYF